MNPCPTKCEGQASKAEVKYIMFKLETRNSCNKGKYKLKRDKSVL
jgi:hypothetical protein